MVRDSQGNPCKRHDMMIFYFYSYDNLYKFANIKNDNAICKKKKKIITHIYVGKQNKKRQNKKYLCRLKLINQYHNTEQKKTKTQKTNRVTLAGRMYFFFFQD